MIIPSVGSDCKYEACTVRCFVFAATALSSFSVTLIRPPNRSCLAEIIELRSPAGVLLPTVGLVSNVQSVILRPRLNNWASCPPPGSPRKPRMCVRKPRVGAAERRAGATTRTRAYISERLAALCLTQERIANQTGDEDAVEKKDDDWVYDCTIGVISMRLDSCILHDTLT